VSVVVSDTSPLHYLILCGVQSALPALFQKVVIPPTVFRELQQPNTPLAVREWASVLPPWVTVQTPLSINLVLDLDAGEVEAICLAQEIKAAALLIDDRAGRIAAIRCGLAVIGTIGILERAAAQGLLELPQTLERLRETNARLDPDLIRGALERDKARKQAWRLSRRDLP
jgi:predicted nucleic acid-binding protein